MNINLIVAATLFVVTLCSNAWSAPVATYVAEFSVSGAAKPEEMKSTIQTLLLSRLAGGNITTQAGPNGAEITITGSYLLSGSVFSLDAAAVNSAGAVITRAFTQGKNPDELIPAVGALAKSLSEGIGKVAAVVVAPQVPSLPPDAVKPAPIAPVTGQSVYKIAGAVSGLAVGRTLPSGERELFVIGNHTLRYYIQGDGLKLVKEIPYKVHEKVLAVDSADLDASGIPEIYVTVMNGEMLASQVWVVDGGSLKQIAGSLPYFFRVVAGAGGIKKLYAQQMSGKDDFSGDVAEVVKSGSGYQLKNPLKLPKQAYLYNFNIITGFKGEQNPIINDRSGYLRVFTAAGDEIWKSGEAYGGSETFFHRTDLESFRISGSIYRQVFLDQRIIVKANGELLVAKNSAPWFMLSKHSYAHNSLYCFAWNGADLEEKWHTKPNDYYLADFAYDDSSRELLLLEVVVKEEGLFDKGASRLVIRKME